MIAPPRPYNPARYFDETLSSSLQVFKSLHENKNGVRETWMERRDILLKAVYQAPPSGK